ncbi:MAG: hypothetical protein JWN43_605 [Gammaproteobacteria bacterium]|nr:hypothetical protein [Gammaproteobacteria bacterium]
MYGPIASSSRNCTFSDEGVTKIRFRPFDASYRAFGAPYDFGRFDAK